jgi:hypothetical protein
MNTPASKSGAQAGHTRPFLPGPFVLAQGLSTLFLSINLTSNSAAEGGGLSLGGGAGRVLIDGLRAVGNTANGTGGGGLGLLAEGDAGNLLEVGPVLRLAGWGCPKVCGANHLAQSLDTCCASRALLRCSS